MFLFQDNYFYCKAHEKKLKKYTYIYLYNTYITFKLDYFSRS